MGTTLDDILYEQHLAEQDSAEEVNSKFEQLVNDRIIDREAEEIFEYIPLNKTDILEEEYVNHLWQSFVHLDGGSEETRAFAILPFHLLFMLSLQYKVLRIHRLLKAKYDLAFIMEHPRDGERDLLHPSSVFTLGFLGESKLIDLLKLVNIRHEVVNRIKELIKYRNDKLAHAKGGITKDLDLRVTEYINCLKELQKYFIDLNDEVAEKWMLEMGTGQEGMDYLDTHVGEEYLCPADMQQGKLSRLEGKLNGL